MPRIFKISRIAGVIAISSIFTAAPASADEEIRPHPPAAAPVAAFGDPLETYRTYLEAVKRNDVPTAIACHETGNDRQTEVAELNANLWISHHRFHQLVIAKFGARESPLLRDDCTDDALNRTLDRVAKSTPVIRGDVAELPIKWDDDDGSANPVFAFTGDEVISFRKTNGQWKIATEIDDGAAPVTAPGTWGWAFDQTSKLLTEASDLIEAETLKTWQETDAWLKSRNKALEKQYKKDYQAPAIIK